MSILSGSLSRLYPTKVTLYKLKSMVIDKSITIEEYKEITGEDYLVDEATNTELVEE
jgi:hypothetical protein